MAVASEKKACRACDSTDLISVLDLGDQPLANRFLTDAQLDEPEPRYPLHMVRCAQCGLCQLTLVVDPEVLYRDYAYQSGHSEGWHTHCEALVQDIARLHPGGSVLDIASNDGTLLRHCRSNGLNILGIDPAHNLDVDADIPVIGGFWPIDLATKFDVIVAQNVFGHVDDARGFLQGIAQALSREGVAIIECPSIVDLVHCRRWDTIYHEHLSYWSSKSLAPLAKQVGLNVTRVAYFPDLHGGTVRYYLAHGNSPEFEIAEGAWGQVFEANRLKAEDFERFTAAVKDQISFWNAYLQNPLGRGLAGYGASAKSSTFLNALPDRPKLVGIFDDNPRKQHLYTPGCHFPILRPAHTVMMACDELINFAPNWDLKSKAESLGFTGSYKSIWQT